MKANASKPLIAAFFFATLFFRTGAANSEEHGDGTPLLAGPGKKLFLTYCVSCHGAEANGDGPVAAVLLIKPADLTMIAKRRSANVSWGEIAKFIDGRTELPAHGRREMPVWGRRFNEEVADTSTKEEITRGDLAALVSYLKSIQQ